MISGYSAIWGRRRIDSGVSRSDGWHDVYFFLHDGELEASIYPPSHSSDLQRYYTGTAARDLAAECGVSPDRLNGLVP